MNETEQKINELIEKLGLHDKARELCDMADWYKYNDSPALSEYCRYAQRTVFDFIDSVRAECKTIKDIAELIDQQQFDCWNYCKYYQLHGFNHFAELAMVRHTTLGEIRAVLIDK